MWTVPRLSRRFVGAVRPRPAAAVPAWAFLVSVALSLPAAPAESAAQDRTVAGDPVVPAALEGLADPVTPVVDGPLLPYRHKVAP